MDVENNTPETADVSPVVAPIEQNPTPPPVQDVLDMPISDWSKVDLGLPQDADLNPATMDSFSKMAISAKMSPRQVQSAASWYLKAAKAQQEEFFQAGAAELAKEWGLKAEANQRAALGLISQVDRMPGIDGAFSKALNFTGAINQPAIAKGLFALSQLIGEDSIGQASGVAAETRPETPEEAFKGMFAGR